MLQVVWRRCLDPAAHNRPVVDDEPARADVPKQVDPASVGRIEKQRCQVGSVETDGQRLVPCIGRSDGDGQRQIDRTLDGHLQMRGYLSRHHGQALVGIDRLHPVIVMEVGSPSVARSTLLQSSEAGWSAAWRSEGVDVVRAISGGLLFGVPMLFTVEVMWTGQHTSASQSLFVVASSLLLLTALNRIGGFREDADVRLRDAFMDAVEGMAVAVVLVFAMLVLLGEVDRSMPFEVVAGKGAYELLPVCIGIGVANTLLKGRPDAGEEEDDGSQPMQPAAPASAVNRSIADLGAGLIGALFVSLSIAPTDEVTMVAAGLSPLWLLVLVAASLLIAYAIVYVADFSGQPGRHGSGGLLQHPVVETLTSYIAGLAVALALLALFQRSDVPPSVLLAQVIVLGLPAAIGGAAGRLAV